MLTRHLACLVVGFASAACGSSSSGPPSTSEPAEVLAPTNTEPATDSKGEVSTHTFESAALGVEKRFIVYLPAGYEGSDKRYPVVYLLHGLTGNEKSWTKHLGLAETADKLGLEAIVVMPDGDDSFYVNWRGATDYDKCMAGQRPFGKEASMDTYCVKTANYEDYLVVDLIAHVDSTFRTIANRDARAIGGLSMGGFGALTLGFRHKDKFSAVASHSGLASLVYKDPYPYQKGKVVESDDPTAWIKSTGPLGVHFAKVFGTTIDTWRAVDPTTLAKSLENGELAIYIDCGTEDEFRLQHGAAYLGELLEVRSVAHQLHLLPGRHQAPFWRDRIDDSLAFFTAHFASSLK